MPVNLVSGFIAPFIFPKFRFCPMPALHTTEPAAWHVQNVFAFLIRFLEGGLKTPFPPQSQVFTLNKQHLIKKLAVGNGDPSCLSRRLDEAKLKKRGINKKPIAWFLPSPS